MELRILLDSVYTHGCLRACESMPTVWLKDQVCATVILQLLPDLVACPEPDPLRNRSVLLGLLGQDPLNLEGLLRRLQHIPDCMSG